MNHEQARFFKHCAATLALDTPWFPATVNVHLPDDPDGAGVAFELFLARTGAAASVPAAFFTFVGMWPRNGMSLVYPVRQHERATVASMLQALHASGLRLDPDAADYLRQAIADACFLIVDCQCERLLDQAMDWRSRARCVRAMLDGPRQ